ncbi:uncharacterized protein LOC125940173 [Dermacentor silvarum]|uniref:uncharacterized protein LOC125940173 n=1 Tax=Dermacentor silvarum TaxID=543639 RepID=UPI002100A95F|nr:uncharacterized protein LOC125940173 [Dermacentor silvarum]
MTNEGTVLGEETLEKLLLYARPRTIIWTSDLFMLLTRREMVLSQEKATSIYGLAWVAGACSVKKMMVVTDVKGLHTTYLVAAHEIGHFTPQAKCLFQDDYVPAITTDPKREEERAAKCTRLLPGGEKLLGTETYGLCSFSCYSDQLYSFVLGETDGTPCNEGDPSMKCRNGACVKEELPPTETNHKEKDQKGNDQKEENQTNSPLTNLSSCMKFLDTCGFVQR